MSPAAVTPAPPRSCICMQRYEAQAGVKVGDSDGMPRASRRHSFSVSEQLTSCLASRGRFPEARRGMIFRNGPSPATGSSMCRSRSPRSMCSRHGSAHIDEASSRPNTPYRHLLLRRLRRRYRYYTCSIKAR